LMALPLRHAAAACQCSSRQDTACSTALNLHCVMAVTVMAVDGIVLGLSPRKRLAWMHGSSPQLSSVALDDGNKSLALHRVLPGLVPGIHVFDAVLTPNLLRQFPGVDGRNKSGQDG